MYADDAVLISRTANGLQLLMDNFTSFMTEKHLKINLSKTLVMSCGKRKSRIKTHYIDGVCIERTSTFSYLGILFNSKGTWNSHINLCKLKFVKSVEAIFRFSQKIGKKPVREILKLYGSKCITGTCYGGALWGMSDITPLQTLENQFLRRLLAVPTSTATIILHRETDTPYISDLISVAALTLWHRIWTREETHFTRDIILDCLIQDYCKKISWLNYIYDILKECNLAANFKIPEAIQYFTRRELKKRLFENRATSRDMAQSTKTCITSYLEGPLFPGIQPYLIFTTNIQYRFYFTRLRLNTLHYQVAFPKMGKWSVNLPKCPCDGRSPQTTVHFLLFCHFYRDIRKKMSTSFYC